MENLRHTRHYPATLRRRKVVNLCEFLFEGYLVEYLFMYDCVGGQYGGFQSGPLKFSSRTWSICCAAMMGFRFEICQTSDSKIYSYNR